MIIVLIILALIFDFLNGFHDSSNVVATPISSGAIPPRRALYMAAVAHFIGPFLFGVAVATAVGEGLLVEDAITTSVVIAALIGAIAWNIITWYFGLPSSSSHALIGGLIGAAVVESGVEAVKLAGLTKIVVALVVSPILGSGVRLPGDGGDPAGQPVGHPEDQHHLPAGAVLHPDRPGLEPRDE